MGITIDPLTPDRWSDFAALMNSRFDTRHCWCMALRTNYRQRSAAENRRSMNRIAKTAAAPPGLLAYIDDEVAGWCAVAPRDEYQRLRKSRGQASADASPVWAVTCFYVLRAARRQGLSLRLLKAAVALARSHGAAVIEGYPVIEGRNQYRGVASVFLYAGFEEIATSSQNRPLMRYRVPRSRAPRPRPS